MSQRIFHFRQADDPYTGADFRAVAGWDRPLARLHLTVEMTIDVQGDDEWRTVWDCLRLPRPELLTLECIMLIVQGFAGKLPVDWVQAVSRDQREGTGNEESHHRLPAK